ncbi:MAG: DUF445 family protein [Desulfobulbaceae bacterium]|nr:DUF445 family protein [Desulfobulbaceae bacterium]
MDIRQFIPYLAPPLVGGFIGYLTNKIAIRMLFRPLKPWRIFGLRLPMTPGVIPSKRHILAGNIGEMVGTHLLTGRDVGEALSREPFQDHLHRLISSNINLMLTREYGTLIEIIPQRFKSYFKIGVRTLKYRLRDGVVAFLCDEQGVRLISNSLGEQLDQLGERKINEMLSPQDRSGFYELLESLLTSLLASPELEKWLGDYLGAEIKRHAEEGKRLEDLIPASLRELLFSLIRDHSPAILHQIASILADPKVREKIIHSIRKAIEDFISSLGPIAALASFIDMGMVENKIRRYLQDKEQAIIEWLQNPVVQEKLSEALCRQVEKFLEMELTELLAKIGVEQFEALCEQVGGQTLAVLRSPGVMLALSGMLRESLENSIDNGGKKLGLVMGELLPGELISSLRANFSEQVAIILRSEKSRQLVTKVINAMVNTLMSKPLGVTGNLIPAGIKLSIIEYVFISVNKILLNEVPGLLDSLNVRRIVTEKVDSLDLFKLERLLLSIMEEQFKYINLFGAILGFIIGLLNVVVMGLI